MTRAPRPRLLALGGLVALAAAIGVGRFVDTPILPFMLADLGLTEGQAGFIASATFAGYLVGALLAAAPKLPGSRCAWLLWALVASALTTAAVGLGTAYAAFLVLRFLGGVASAFHEKVGLRKSRHFFCKWLRSGSAQMRGFATAVGSKADIGAPALTQL